MPSFILNFNYISLDPGSLRLSRLTLISPISTHNTLYERINPNQISLIIHASIKYSIDCYLRRALGKIISKELVQEKTLCIRNLNIGPYFPLIVGCGFCSPLSLIFFIPFFNYLVFSNFLFFSSLVVFVIWCLRFDFVIWCLRFDTLYQLLRLFSIRNE